MRRSKLTLNAALLDRRHALVQALQSVGVPAVRLVPPAPLTPTPPVTKVGPTVYVSHPASVTTPAHLTVVSTPAQPTTPTLEPAAPQQSWYETVPGIMVILMAVAVIMLVIAGCDRSPSGQAPVPAGVQQNIAAETKPGGHDRQVPPNDARAAREPFGPSQFHHARPSEPTGPNRAPPPGANAPANFEQPERPAVAQGRSRDQQRRGDPAESTASQARRDRAAGTDGRPRKDAQPALVHESNETSWDIAWWAIKIVALLGLLGVLVKLLGREHPDDREEVHDPRRHARAAAPRVNPSTRAPSPKRSYHGVPPSKTIPPMSTRSPDESLTAPRIPDPPRPERSGYEPIPIIAGPRKTPGSARLCSHVLPCQDKRVACEDSVETLVLGDLLVAAVADGVGSANKAYLAARWATSAALAEIMALHQRGVRPDAAELKKIVAERVPSRMLERLEASNPEGDPQQYKTTLSLAVLDRDTLHYAMTGDGVLMLFDPATRRWEQDDKIVVIERNRPEAVYPTSVPVRAHCDTHKAPCGAVVVVGSDGLGKALYLLLRNPDKTQDVFERAGALASARRSADTFLDVFVNGAFSELLDANDDVSFAVLVSDAATDGARDVEA
jgi:hypothetical protein